MVEEANSMQELGERIRKKRQALKIPISELAGKIGVTSSLISQIERAKASPSILTLKKIANVLHTTVGELIGENDTLLNHPLMTTEERKFVKKNDEGASLFLLSNHAPRKEMDTFVIEFEKKANSSQIMTSKNPRQEFCYALKGKLKVQYGNQEYTMEEGDSFYFYSNQNHLFTNIGNNRAEMLWIVNQ